MSDEAWHERWRQGRIGFHLAAINPHLQQWWPTLGVSAAQGVFVPLCGKSIDMHWLARLGHLVVGVELSPIAVADFFAEAGLNPVRSMVAGVECWRHENIVLYCGDMFSLRREHLGDVSSFYDRGALVALPPEMRVRYQKHLADVLPAGSRGLVITLDYPQAQMAGPPFSVNEQELRAISAEAFSVDRLACSDVLAQEPHFAARGVSQMSECVHRLVRRHAN